MKDFSKLGIILLCVVVSLVSFTFWFMNSLPVPESKLNKLEVGMNGEQVERIIGAPNFQEGKYVWGYSRRFLWSSVRVHFSTNGSFLRYAPDY